MESIMRCELRSVAQNDAERFPASHTAQAEWIVAQREARRIAGVFHLGDITNRNTPEQRKNALAAMQFAFPVATVG